jgi:hypothetical protein
MDSLKDRTLVTNVSGGSQSQTANQTGAHVGNDISVKVRHNQNHGLVAFRVGNHLPNISFPSCHPQVLKGTNLQASVIQQLSVELDLRKVLGNVPSSRHEKTIGHLHDSSLVNDTNVLLAN